MTLTLGVTAAVSAVIIWRLVVRHGAGRGSSLFVLAVAPAALLMLATGASAGTWEIIQGFWSISRLGTGGGEAAVLQVCHAFLSGLRLAAGATLIVLGVAAVLQLMARAPAEADESSTVSLRFGLQGWTLVALPLLIIPTSLLVHLTSELPRFIVEGALDPMRTHRTGSLRTGVDLNAFTQMVSRRLVGGVTFGLSLSAVLSGATIASLLAHRAPRLPAWLRTYAWVAFVLMTAILIGLLLDLSTEIRFLHTWASQAPTRPPVPE